MARKEHPERTLLELIELIYDAAVDPAQWALFVETVGRVLHAYQCAFHVHDFQHQRSSEIAAQIGFDSSYQKSYREYYVSKNVFMIHGTRHLWPGSVCSDQELCPEHILLRSEFYNDWMAPQGALHGLEATVVKDKSLASFISVVREKRAKLFREKDVTLLQTLMPHLQRAVQLYHKVSDLRLLQEAERDALDRWSLGVIVLSRDHRVLFMNQAAEILVHKRDGIVQELAGLRATSPDQTERLRDLVRSATLAGSGCSLEPGGGVIALSRQSGKRPLNVLVTPLSPHQNIVAEENAACALFVSDPELYAETDEQILKHLYGLTSAEAKVASLLVQGHDAKYISDALTVSFNTVHTHMKRVFEKTSTRRQAELVHLMLRAPVSSSLKTGRKRSHPSG